MPKHIIFAFDDIYTKDRPILLSSIIELIKDTNVNLNIGSWDLTKNDVTISASSMELRDIDKINEIPISGLVIVLTGNKFPVETINRIGTRSGTIPVLFISNYSQPLVAGYNFIHVCNDDDDIKWFLSTLLSRNVKMSNSETPASNTSPWQSIKPEHLPLPKLINEFENSRLSFDNWTHKTQMMIIYESLKKYGYDGTYPETSWLCVNWKKYIYNVMNLEYNTYWHYSIIRFWVEMIHKYADYSQPFEYVYNAQNMGWIKNPQLWSYYYSPNILFSPSARDGWIPPNLRSI